ncbi:MAG: VPLPA-CTERM sorting domain-containing protein [Roseovarius sp.]|jgi:hypothetical protein|uniref:VPLPA-CTERM sorting domain-containing protein n=1 Tax=Roseovarius sp. TaxID=1486281 RepID=UPI0032EB79EF
MKIFKLAGTIPALAFVVLLASGVSSAQATTLYEAPADRLGGLCPTCAGTATKMGDDISLAGGPATLNKLIWDTSNFGADYTAEIKVDFFNVDLSGTTPGVGSLIHTQTSDHFLAGGNGGPETTFVDIAIADVLVPERFIYSIEVVNNNGSTNWNVAGQFATNSTDEDETLAQAQVGANNEFDFIFGDWVPESGTDTSGLTFQRLSMASYQIGLPQFSDFAEYSNFTPNVTFEGQVAPIPLPAAGWLLLTAFGGLGIAARRRKAA